YKQCTKNSDDSQGNDHLKKCQTLVSAASARLAARSPTHTAHEGHAPTRTSPINETQSTVVSPLTVNENGPPSVKVARLLARTFPGGVNSKTVPWPTLSVLPTGSSNVRTTALVVAFLTSRSLPESTSTIGVPRDAAIVAPCHTLCCTLCTADLAS